MSVLLEPFLLILPLAGYLFRAIGLYTIAERRRINNSWLSWIPVINAWVLGCISDQYRCVARGQTTNRRTLLLILPILKIVSFIAAAVAGIITAAADANYFNAAFVSVAALCLLICLIQYILEQMVSFDLYRSANPETAVLFLMLGILIPALRPVFIFADRQQEIGMPPRVRAVP